ncbi:MAG: serine hydroxymethyltransferase [Gammaproteobacteria bacterium]|nr:serine hydroxymethyltransferase [Gammaproteobacteria bacterium]MCD8542993.1 serine hydroxymethyltransferase [Gammaproteobacteria bacterium]
MFNQLSSIKAFDPQVYAAMSAEAVRQEEHVELIASENYVSVRVLEAQGSLLTNKYAEGYPNKRYYGGCEYVDQVELVAIERLKQLFNADYANVQPHSGSQANYAVFMALLQPGDTFMGMDLAQGGHLTHGSSVNFSGKLYHCVSYGVNAEGDIDYDDMLKKARQYKPKMIIGGFSAYSGLVDWARMREIADDVGAYFMVDMAHIAGLIAAGVYPSPVPYADVVTSTTHKTLRGPRGGVILARHNDALVKRFNSAIFPGCQGGPLMHVIAAKAIAFQEALSDEFKWYQKQVIKNAQVMAGVLIQRGFKIVSGGTKNHLMLVDLIGRDISGKEAEEVLGRANITANKNMVPNDPASPFTTSGLRLGTPAITTRGFKEEQVQHVAHVIADVLSDWKNEVVISDAKKQMLTLCQQFPVY